MSLTFLLGAIIGSGLFIVAGRGPAERLVAMIHKRAKR
jgi:hypothetical protein